MTKSLTNFGLILLIGLALWVSSTASASTIQKLNRKDTPVPVPLSDRYFTGEGDQLEKRSGRLFTFSPILRHQDKAKGNNLRKDLTKRGFWEFAWKATTIVMAPTWYGIGQEVISLSCSITQQAISTYPDFVDQVCFANSMLGPFVNGMGGSHDLKYALDNYLGKENETYELATWIADLSVRDKRDGDDSDRMFRSIFNNITKSKYEQDGNILLHDPFDGFKVVPLYHTRGATIDDPVVVSLSTSGRMVFPALSVWWSISNDPRRLPQLKTQVLDVVKVTDTERLAKRQGDDLCWDKEIVWYDEGEEGYALCQPYAGEEPPLYIDYGHNFYGTQDQFQGIYFDVGGGDVEGGGTGEFIAQVSNDAIEKNWQKACSCIQAEGEWVSTGSFQLLTDPNGYVGYEDCYQENCGGNIA